MWIIYHIQSLKLIICKPSPITLSMSKTNPCHLTFSNLPAKPLSTSRLSKISAASCFSLPFHTSPSPGPIFGGSANPKSVSITADAIVPPRTARLA